MSFSLAVPRLRHLQHPLRSARSTKASRSCTRSTNASYSPLRHFDQPFYDYQPFLAGPTFLTRSCNTAKNAGTEILAAPARQRNRSTRIHDLAAPKRRNPRLKATSRTQAPLPSPTGGDVLQIRITTDSVPRGRYLTIASSVLNPRAMIPEGLLDHRRFFSGRARCIRNSIFKERLHLL